MTNDPANEMLPHRRPSNPYSPSMIERITDKIDSIFSRPTGTSNAILEGDNRG